MSNVAQSRLAPGGASDGKGSSATAPTITVHWLNNSRSQRILWLLEELEIPYEVKKYERDAKMLAPQSLKDIHPIGHSPVVTFEENGKTIVLAESGAIVEFIIERYGKGKLQIPPTADAEQRSQYLYWLHFAEGTAMMPLIFGIVCAQMPRQGPFFARPIVSIVASQLKAIFVTPRLNDNFAMVEAHLANKSYFVGDDLTGADRLTIEHIKVMNIFVVEGIPASMNGWGKYPNSKAWFEKMEERPAYKRALEKGGNNDLGAFVR